MRALIAALLLAAAVLSGDALAIRANGDAVIASGGSCPATENNGVLLSRCLTVTVTNCPAGTKDGGSAAVASSVATIKVSDPASTSTGTIIFATGTTNQTFWESSNDVSLYMLPALARNQRLVQITWQSAPKWGEGAAGWLVNHCRSATAWKAIHGDATLTTAGTPFIVLGHSAGASQVAYSLAHYDGPSYIDLAIMSAGPPHSKMRFGVQGSDNSAWQTECFANKVSVSNPSCAYGSMLNYMDTAYGGDGAGGGTYSAFTNKSCHGGIDNFCGGNSDILRGDAVLSYPQTAVHFLFGDLDLTVATPLGQLFARAVKSANTQHTITQQVGNSHNQVPDDAGALIDSLFAAATFRH